MQVSVETTSGLERRVTISVPAEQIESEVDSRLKRTARSARIDGFRPGKAPLKEIKRRYGAGVRQEVMSEVMRNNFVEAVTQEKLNPAGSPSIEPTKVEPGQDLEFVATFEVYPEFELASIENAEVERPSAEVTDADVDNMIETLRKQQASWQEVERPAAEGDQVNIDFEGFVDDEAFEGGSAQGHDLVLGSNSFIPGFEEQLIGAAKGDEKEVKVTFPEDYQAEQLAGKEAVFKVTVNSVSEQVLPELNDEFFAKFGVEEGGEEAFRAEVKKNMERELQQGIKNKVKNQVLDALLEANPIEVPKALVDSEIDTLRQQAVQQFGGGQNFDASMLPAELFEEQAVKRVKLGLLMAEVIKVNELKADADRVRSMVEEIAQTYQQPEQVVDFYYGNQQQLAQVEHAVLEDQVVEKLLDQANVKDVESTYEEAIKPAEPKADETEAEEKDGDA